VFRGHAGADTQIGGIGFAHCARASSRYASFQGGFGIGVTVGSHIGGISIVCALACAWGCGSVSVGDTAFAACLGDDGQMNCSNPDCQGFAQCRLPLTDQSPDESAGMNDGVGSDDGSGAPTGDDPPPSVASPVPDAGATAGAADEDAGADDVVITPPDACGGCPDDLRCVGEVCQPVGATSDGMFLVTVSGATVPIKDHVEQCYDIFCSVVSAPFSACTGRPSVYVRVLRLRDGVSTEIGRTTTAEPGLMPSFDDPPFPVSLREGDILLFEVWDADDPDDDDLIYPCRPDLRDVTSGSIDCSTPAGPLFLQEYTVSASIAPVAP
jgi:hypothetical protein